jgi:hypothetical protein
MGQNSLKALLNIQEKLEETYEFRTGLDVRDFVLSRENFSELGRLEVHQSKSEVADLDLAVILDRDLLSAYLNGSEDSRVSTSRATSVVFEEISHFVYLAFNHLRGRNITRLEMEIQSEVDRILLAYDQSTQTSSEIRESLWKEMTGSTYSDPRYEASRRAALGFIRSLSSENPAAWTRTERQNLLRFFHSDLSEKLYLSKV